MSRKRPISLETKKIPTVIVGVFSPRTQTTNPEYYFEEFLSLVKTLGMEYDHTHFIKLRQIDNNLYLTKGKLHDLVEFCNENNIEQVVFSEILTSVQERNLEEVLGCEVFDRERIILEIFKKAAHTSEGKVQVEMAELEYLKTRLIGKGREFAQQAGVIGTRGPGETYKEIMRRHIEETLRQARKRLVTLEKSRDVQRKRRLDRRVPLVCLVGYTNAGKSSILNALTKSNVLAEDKLFATLDTTTRELYLGGHDKKVLISDTVGFISQLPHNLVASFKSTLAELSYSNVLLHVIDISNPAWKNQISVVNQTLAELGVDKPIIHLFNKIDKLSTDEQEKVKPELEVYQPYIITHATSKQGVAPLLELLTGYDFKG